jgi:hypothetical protein
MVTVAVSLLGWAVIVWAGGELLAVTGSAAPIKEDPMINWPEILRDVEHWANGFLTGAAVASLIAIAGTAIALLARVI